MLRRQCPTYLDHLLRLDSETESDDESNNLNAKRKLKKLNAKSDDYRSKNLDTNNEHISEEEKLIYDDQSKKIECQTKSENEKGHITKKENRRKRKRSKKNDESLEDNHRDGKKSKNDSDGDSMMKLAEEYQEHMKRTPVPKIIQSSELPFITWHGLAKSMRRFHAQPLHYLTYVVTKQWDQSRSNGTDDEEMPTKNIIPSTKAVDIIWEIEQVHRVCTCPSYLAKLWLTDPEYLTYANEVLPTAPAGL